VRESATTARIGCTQGQRSHQTPTRCHAAILRSHWRPPFPTGNATCEVVADGTGGDDRVVRAEDGDGAAASVGESIRPEDVPVPAEVSKAMAGSMGE
jgi:hypothetical protein